MLKSNNQIKTNKIKKIKFYIFMGLLYMFTNLVEVDVIIKRNKVGESCGSEPSNCVSANWEKYKSHVEFKCLCCSFCCE